MGRGGTVGGDVGTLFARILPSFACFQSERFSDGIIRVRVETVPEKTRD